MSARPKSKNYVLEFKGEDASEKTYHFTPRGSDRPTAVIKYFRQNGFMYRWGVRGYGQDKDPWQNRPNQRDVVAIAERQFSVPRETSAPKGGTS